jgi:hypothetical protein
MFAKLLRLYQKHFALNSAMQHVQRQYEWFNDMWASKGRK